MPLDCVSVAALQIPVANNSFDKKYSRNLSDDAADVIFAIE